MGWEETLETKGISSCENDEGIYENVISVETTDSSTREA